MWKDGVTIYGIFRGVCIYGTSRVFYNYPKLSFFFFLREKKELSWSKKILKKLLDKGRKYFLVNKGMFSRVV